jgi:hypothetical protein
MKAWVIVGPKGRVLLHTVAHGRNVAWLNLLTRDQRRARARGYRAVRVTVTIDPSPPARRAR